MLCAVTAGLEGRDGPLVTHHDVYGGSFELLRILSTIHRVPVEIIDATNVEAWLRMPFCRKSNREAEAA